MQATANAYVFGDRHTAADKEEEGRETWTPEERAWWDAKAEEEAWAFAESVLRPWAEVVGAIGHPELTRVTEKALAEVEGSLAAARDRLERVEEGEADG